MVEFESEGTVYGDFGYVLVNMDADQDIHMKGYDKKNCLDRQ